MARKDTILFREYAIPAGTSTSFKKTIDATCRSKKITFNFYRGQELQLKVKPMILKRDKTYESLLSFADNTDVYIAGDAEYQEFNCEKLLQKDDKIVIEVENTAAFECSLIADVEVEY
jgi:hypothetical protein